ncbi:DUF1697 domain-containing protein [Lutimonas zeaxanthinifaciens]|uniref:DUF1697 domain-containing protein n=1 Tax=Lutimonas zeaxanthinifaciens TaxID=3060215 RepID=UPI00265CD4B3|nr:DUF1697 domain-containing protein [Lutimonas sp. YSD2104]WKK67463.1 DUF1697 domain-containing protein [Lutimonas sp. YSD2104]
MNIYIALLRGINVSGKNVMKMADLKNALSGLNLEYLQTYVQSGNLVFMSEEDDSETLSKSISGLIFQKFNYQVEVKVLKQKEFHQNLAENPYLDRPLIDVKKLYYINLFGILSSEDFDKLIERDKFSEEMVLGKTGQIIYVLYNNGFGRSKLTHRYFENKLKVFVTARNHNTMTKLDILSDNLKNIK